MAETLLFQGVPSNPANGLRVRLGWSMTELDAGTPVMTLSPQSAQFQHLEPVADHRHVRMPQVSASQGLFFRIQNISDTHNITVQDAAGADLIQPLTIGPGEAAFVICDGVNWIGMN